MLEDRLFTQCKGRVSINRAATKGQRRAHINLFKFVTLTNRTVQPLQEPQTREGQAPHPAK